MSGRSFATLADCIRAFDRKERGYVIRQALGPDIRLTDEFCTGISTQAQIEPPLKPDDVRWFIDYHFDWLPGALRSFALQDDCVSNSTNSIEFTNTFFEPPNVKWRQDHADEPDQKGQLIQGNQEDIDLLLVRGCDLIFVEAKWFGGWEPIQFMSKMNRIYYLTRFMDEFSRTDSACPVNLHFVLMAPNAPPPEFECYAKRFRTKMENTHPGSIFPETKIYKTRRDGHESDARKVERTGKGANIKGVYRRWRVLKDSVRTSDKADLTAVDDETFMPEQHFSTIPPRCGPNRTLISRASPRRRS